MPKDEITLTIAPNGWVYKHTSAGVQVLMDGVTAENEKKVIYLCDRRDDCKHCDDLCNATKNVEHAVGFVKGAFGEYRDERIDLPENKKFKGWKYVGKTM